MRAPRYRFPDAVRSATRNIASTMAEDGAVAETPEQFEAWLAERPEFRGALERGGYGKTFTSGDLFPLLRVFLEERRVSPPTRERPVQASRRWWIVGLVLLLLLVVVGLIVLLGTERLP
jgi:ferric-dicitrate binding protein FerR (iron transport regulator)